MAKFTSMTAAGAGREAAFFLLFLPSIHKLRLTTQHPLDEACLANLRSSMEDPAGNLHNWTKATLAARCNGFTSDLQGVTCNNGRVHKLSLAGTISPLLSNCTNLQSFDLSSNHLHGCIPAQPRRPQPLLQPPLRRHPAGARPASPPLYFRRLRQLSLRRRSGHAQVQRQHLPREQGTPIAAIVGIGLASGILSLVFSFAVVSVWLWATAVTATAKEERSPSSCRRVERRRKSSSSS